MSLPAVRSAQREKQMHKTLILGAILGATLSGPALAQDYAGAARAYFETDIAPQMAHQMIVSAIRAQNEAHAGITQARIDELDQAWMAEVGGTTRPTIDPVMTNPVSDLLREMVAASEGLIAEIFVMDYVGLNVGASHVTSDYWQGDEAKHQQTHGIGPGAYHVGNVDFDESTQSYVVQVSMSIVDPADGALIGAVTASIDADSLVD